MKNKKQHQVKSRFYYIFWGTATVAVVFGQIYVGSGYHMMSESFNRLIDIATEKVYYEEYECEFEIF